MCWKQMLLQFYLKVTYRTRQVRAELPFFLKILEPTSFLLSHSRHTFHHLFLVYCINHSLLPVLPLSNTHSLYQTIADTARAIVYKRRALILHLKYSVFPCFTQNQSLTHQPIPMSFIFSSFHIYFPSLSLSSIHMTLSYFIVSV